MINPIFNNNINEIKTNKKYYHEILNILPKIFVNENNINNLKFKTCVICMEDFKISEEIINTPCLHTYHSNCLKQWFETKDICVCPVCKTQINEDNI